MSELRGYIAELDQPDHLPAVAHDLRALLEKHGF